MEDEAVAMISNERTNISRHHRCRRQQTDENSSSYLEYKGVMKMPNGCGWAARIYANHKRNWLGVFETNKEAAMAYDSASLKLRRESHRNFPSTELTVHESTFQDLYSTEAILNMIKDGSYQSKFMDFYLNLTKNNASTSQRQPSEEAGTWHHELFHKELTTNDVGKYNRLEIPEEDAIRYFSIVPEVSTERAEDGNKVKTMNLAFLDKQLKLWNSQYCYQRSSQSFVFAEGWNNFVEDKGLKANDIISFYRVDYKRRSGEVGKFYMIDANKKNEEINNYRMMDSSHVQLGMEEETLGGSMEEQGRRGEAIKKGFRLFGVNIG
ncbi:AP2/ERF and B3 domain-containing transcription factor At1g50680-like [Macadamia integrifolia]|uniref:AP2/ERF and B3 domain-containing transcription factor At1g50680-like n=1 Tax=Macadamia integrifolia TaxID=60698 RepID=UPI001C4FFCA3|nr:AP2/ERF and B3 domain-containing transcription factor At1g50680-like [Macadamia integrifolia]